MISFKNILTQKGNYELEIETITTDAEIVLIKAINHIFPKIKHFNCFFHYKQEFIKNSEKKEYVKKIQ